MGSMGNEERFDAKGKLLAKRRVFETANLNLNTGFKGNDEDNIWSPYKPQTEGEKQLWSLVSRVMDRESFFLKEFSIADNPAKIESYANVVQNLYERIFIENRMKIGLVSSWAGREYNSITDKLSKGIGTEIANRKGMLCYNNRSSATFEATRAFELAGGDSIDVLFREGNNEGSNVYNSVQGPLESSGLAYACDSLILVSGDMDVLPELIEAYEARRPVIAMLGSGGWADILAGKYFDSAKGMKIYDAESPKVAVELAYSKGLEVMNW